MENENNAVSSEPQEKPEKRFSFRAAAAWFLITFGILIGRSVSWVRGEWADLQVSEFVWHLTAPLQGTDMGIVKSYFLETVPFMLAAVLILYVVYRFVLKRRVLFRRLFLLLALAYGIGSVIFLASELHLVDWIINRNKESTFIEEHYVDPEDVKIVFPEKKRNLLFIYLESAEVTYTDPSYGGAFKEDVIPELSQLAMEEECFAGTDDKLNGGVSLANTTFTMGAMFGDTSGLPLITPFFRGRLDIQKSFMPDLVTLGDILEEEGYRQILQIGSQAVFGGRKLYFEQHGNFEMRDYGWAVENGKIPEDYYVWWGFEDKYLFEQAKETLDELGAGDQPFNLTLLTVDTHYPDGYVCDLCREDYDDQYSNVFACSSRQVTEFVEWCRQQDWYEDTAVILVGDHPTMDENFCKKVPKTYQRKTYTAFLNSSVTPARDTYREYSTLDYFPTTLAAMGVEIEGDRLGLGTNLFADKDTLLEEFDRNAINLQFSRNSAFMDRLTADMNVKASADVEIGELDPETKLIHVKAWNLQPEILDGVRVRVNREGEKKSVMRVDLPETEDHVWEGDVDLSEFPSGTTLSLRICGREFVGGRQLRASFPLLYKQTVEIP